MSLHGDFREFLSSLISNRVKFLIVGAHALAIHARPRFTGDLDVWVGRSPENAARVVAALGDFGFPGHEPHAFTEENRILTLGREPVRIDLFTDIPGLEFEAAFGRRMSVELGGLALPVLSRQDLIASKRASGRPKDLLDLELLREADKTD